MQITQIPSVKHVQITQIYRSYLAKHIRMIYIIQIPPTETCM